MTKKWNAFERLNANRNSIIESFIHIFCPFCNNKLKSVYIMNTLLVCEKCNKVYELVLKEDNQTIEQIKKDGWLKEKEIFK